MTAINEITSLIKYSPAKPSTNNAVGIKETITSLIIAFMLAFLFRGFVIEGFQIPTGSMAPTLMGKHTRLVNSANGYDWPIGPWNYNNNGVPLSQQAGIETKYPMMGTTASQLDGPLVAGDRVFVLKYLPMLQSPKRWDVVVFKNPGTHENYIKRLVGMPGEQIAIVDGDIFTRKFVEDQTKRAGWDSWESSEWHVARKSERVQRAMFQDVFNSHYAPALVEPSYRSPFTGSTPGWEGVLSDSSYQYTGTGDTALAWNANRPITDANSYNAYSQSRLGYNMLTEPDGASRTSPFPVSDVSLALNIKTEDSPMRVSAVLDARGMEFRGVVDSVAGIASIEMRPANDSADAQAADWQVLDSQSIDGFKAGEIHHIEFWHVDQAMWLFIDDKLVCGGADNGAYELSPAGRAVAVTGMQWDEIEGMSAGNGATTKGVFSKTDIYRKPGFRWEFSGGAFTLYHVAVQRDIAYQINRHNPTRGGHPGFYPTLTDEEYFMCGDNSSNSLDSRLWEPGSINRWVEQEVNDRVGVVHKDLVVGRAFMVYFPAPLDGGIPLKKGRKISPDVGRARWIW